MDILKCGDITDILFKFKILNPTLEDGQYQIMSKDFFEPKLFGSIKLKKLLGFEKWNYALGGSDCGKFAIRYAAQLFKKYQDSERADYYQGGTMPSLLVGFVKYYSRFGFWHIVNSTIVRENGEYKLVFFERTEDGFNWVELSDLERSSIQYFHAY
jgi:hypothetical protein